MDQEANTKDEISKDNDQAVNHFVTNSSNEFSENEMINDQMNETNQKDDDEVMTNDFGKDAKVYVEKVQDQRVSIDPNQHVPIESNQQEEKKLPITNSENYFDNESVKIHDPSAECEFDNKNTTTSQINFLYSAEIKDNNNNNNNTNNTGLSFVSEIESLIFDTITSSVGCVLKSNRRGLRRVNTIDEMDLVAHVVSLPNDFISSEVVCKPVLNTDNSCYVINGFVTLTTITDEAYVMERKVLKIIKKAMKNDIYIEPRISNLKRVTLLDERGFLIGDSFEPTVKYVEGIGTTLNAVHLILFLSSLLVLVLLFCLGARRNFEKNYKYKLNRNINVFRKPEDDKESELAETESDTSMSSRTESSNSSSRSKSSSEHDGDDEQSIGGETVRSTLNVHHCHSMTCTTCHCHSAQGNVEFVKATSFNTSYNQMKIIQQITKKYYNTHQMTTQADDDDDSSSDSTRYHDDVFDDERSTASSSIAAAAAEDSKRIEMTDIQKSFFSLIAPSSDNPY